MKRSTTILRGLNDIRASYILESELPDNGAVLLPPSDNRTAWKKITSNGWFAAAVCAVVAFGTLTGIVLAGRGGPGGITPPVGTQPTDTTAEETTEAVTETAKEQRGLMKQTVYDAEGNETYCTKYTYENGLFVRERNYLNGRGTDMKVYTYNENGLVTQEKYTFDEVPSAGWTNTYEYDEQGRVIRRYTAYDSDKPAEEVHTEYDESGRISREESKDSVTIYNYGENGSYTVLTEYKNEATVTRLERITDERGNMIRERHYRNGELTRDHVYEYNEKDQKIKNYLCPTDGSASMSNVIEYDYDERGNLIRTTITSDEDDITTVHSYEYNEYGEMTKELRYAYMSSELVSFSTVVYEYGIIS